ncbi:MAG: FadR family transcriptional regulator [Candidatus Lindowbacteria bacterium]|nr:FadR family transcriptional regulator [Candidatus Lindowbacteria bacterium]
MANSIHSKMLDAGGKNNVVQLRPIEKTTIPGEIIDQIVSMLLTGKVKPGDRLPPERELCESLNVGRSSVREALKALETLGIIRRDIRGTTICPPEDNRYPSLSLAAGAASLEQLLESARIVGIEAAGLAAERAGREDIERISKRIEESEDTQKAAAIHFSFHRALVQAARNPVLSQMYNMLTALVAQSRQLSAAVQSTEEDERRIFIRDIFGGHRRILRAVESHDPAAAKKAMKEHFECMESMALKSERRGKKSQRGSL